MSSDAYNTYVLPETHVYSSTPPNINNKKATFQFRFISTGDYPEMWELKIFFGIGVEVKMYVHLEFVLES